MFTDLGYCGGYCGDCYRGYYGGYCRGYYGGC